MSTITRDGTTLTPTDVIGLSLTYPTRSVVHQIIGTDSPVVTVRTPGRRTGVIRTFWWTYASAEAAVAALWVPGGPWQFTLDGLGGTFTAYVAGGDLVIEAAHDEGRRWFVDIPVQGV